VAVVLVAPRSPGNIGMVARAMANFGVRDLRLVAPCDHLAAEARKFAVEGADRLETATLYPDLAGALADCRWSVATTRRTGRRRGAALDVSRVPELAAALGPGERLALVFGREDAGLASREVALCSHTATIATPGPLGSLNLAQAVLICLYELRRAAPASSAPAERPGLGELEPLFAQMTAVLERIAFFNPHRPEHVLTPLRRIYTRGIDERRELALLRSLWGRLGDSINDWRGRRRGDENRGKTG